MCKNLPKTIMDHQRPLNKYRKAKTASSKLENKKQWKVCQRPKKTKREFYDSFNVKSITDKLLREIVKGTIMQI